MKGRRLKNSYLVLTWLTLTLKTYVVTRFAFSLEIENFMQEIILMLACGGSILFLLCLCLFGNKKGINSRIFITNLFLTILLYFNLIYYRFFNDFITIPVLFQTDNASDLGSSIISLLNPLDILLVLDLGLLVPLKKRFGEIKIKKRKILLYSLLVIAANLVLANIERPQLLTRSFDRNMLVKNLGVFNYQLYDAYLQTKTSMNRAFADSSQIGEIVNYTNAIKKPNNEDLEGIAKGKNVFVISMESTQNFVINEKIEGQDITPFLNSLIKSKDTYYFNNFYHQTGQGKTSDSEFLVENSLYGLPRGAVFFTHSQNTFKGLPSLLSQSGYSTAVFHANNESFWNRDVMYKSLGYHQYFSDEYYDITDENSIGWGLKDDIFFAQSMQYLRDLKQPFYAKFITLTNHFPFSLEEEDELISEWNSEDGTVNRYFTTVRYEDESLKKFFEMIKKEGLYENSIFILMGDHYGISSNHNEAMAQFLGKEITPFQETQLQKVPMIVHIPGINNGKTIKNISGQIDVKPSILNLLGVKDKTDVTFGSDLFTEYPDNFTVLRDGSFITEKYLYTKNRCYDKQTELEIDGQYCKQYAERAQKELNASDQVIYGDLLRFINQTGYISDRSVSN
ncbi:LTA synthase family protein [Cytobacillus firmus]|uniref:Alkaline phosphatase n=1 Tax=Cytobacillus firmus DS1 TaxID=1307436 RepID=W7KYW2_CYTFI|nr:LTA synthase family protein [Cytobacillus firmus]EWG08516.1 alkaline phosphatase [Cytobacillus firmus DS1]